MTRLAAMLALAVAVALPGPAMAQTATTPAILTLDEARAIATRSGMVQIEEISLDDDDGTWEIEGRDAAGREVELEIDARTGAVVERDD